jgi:hypothetical protein
MSHGRDGYKEKAKIILDASKKLKEDFKKIPGIILLSKHSVSL